MPSARNVPRAERSRSVERLIAVFAVLPCRLRRSAGQKILRATVARAAKKCRRVAALDYFAIREITGRIRQACRLLQVVRGEQHGVVAPQPPDHVLECRCRYRVEV